MGHVLETAPSGRAKCRGCGQAIAKGDLRFGERLPNPYGDGDMTLWFHPQCGAYKRPEPFLEALSGSDTAVNDAGRLEATARFGAAHRRLPRLHGVERDVGHRSSSRTAIASTSMRNSGLARLSQITSGLGGMGSLKNSLRTAR